ncbi:BrxA/BrxB family bacilliredoxin [Staphylococcus muscae]|uniref:Bacillithiol system oxidoreductase, YphP/YqiW family n=1 Tax=Staphylococcus muscae TaxID=1294 RepID=A0A240C4N6_9STAP|nr:MULTISPECIES: bacilliredoxin BrxB [Staphylococcus]AVQ33114.1 BrxA/BrxB family bacilliredoxin [Staphylococcus muscae]PNZ04747.1 BrxA/BrxB family bacilliredoxin [Staphylococcus muscae]UXR79288.1 BrxA/BrxB family bacilliredoxin [Staphylococcus sp. IVB6227]UXR81539.1 BrxA/BrxB family bacilliredoxin [Staphylococcus sp. IVB6214]SNW02562.1 bacillithiol system oxidoreductase, YphP/YqiW family [Staphylococcus muscae]
MDLSFDLYMNNVVQQAREDLVKAGYEELTTEEEVDNVFKQDGTTLVMINSVCGCAGGMARPAAQHALHYDVLPDRLVTVFAGQDKEATQRARDYFEGYAPSSPSFALMKDGKITEMIERHQIEGHDTMDVITQLQRLFDKYCVAE